MISYELNTESAKKSDAGGFLSESGKYTGKFLSAHQVISQKGSYGIEFTFEDDNGSKANFITIWTHNSQKEELFGAQYINAIMTVLSLRSLTQQQGLVEDWNGNKEMKNIFPDLVGKRLGVVFQKEEYEKSGGRGIGSKLNIFAIFNADTELTASEILNRQTEPKLLEQHMARLKNKLLPANSGGGYQQNQNYQAAGYGSGMDDMDSDIPF